MKTAVVALLCGFVLAVAAMLLGGKMVSPKGRTAHTITVAGESRLVGEPDTGLVALGVTKSGKTVSEVQGLLAAALDKVIAAVQAAGVKKEDIATSDLSLTQDWDWRGNRPSGYSASTRLTVTVRDVQQVGRVVDSAVSSGLNRLDGVSYQVRDPKWREKALGEALDNARAKAEAMARRTGAHLGRVASIQERGERQTSPAEEQYASQEWAAASRDKYEAPRAPRALPGQRALTVQVEVVYELGRADRTGGVGR
jgi:uncharacterized protein YggE